MPSTVIEVVPGGEFYDLAYLCGEYVTTRSIAAEVVAMPGVPSDAEQRGPTDWFPLLRLPTSQQSRSSTKEIEALVAAPDRHTSEGCRDHALVHLAVHTGLRVSELTGLDRADVHLGTGPHLNCHDKGRKQRAVPFTPTTAAVLRVWLQERQGADTDPLFCTRTGRRLTRDAIARRTSPSAPPDRETRVPRGGTSLRVS